MPTAPIYVKHRQFCKIKYGLPINDLEWTFLGQTTGDCWNPITNGPVIRKAYPRQGVKMGSKDLAKYRGTWRVHPWGAGFVYSWRWSSIWLPMSKHLKVLGYQQTLYWLKKFSQNHVVIYLAKSRSISGLKTMNPHPQHTCNVTDSLWSSKNALGNRLSSRDDFHRNYCLRFFSE